MSAIRREPALNVPMALVAVIGALVAIHAILVQAGPYQQYLAVTRYGFIPARLTDPAWSWEVGIMWLSYAFLHGDWSHLGLNSLWLVVFGTPVLKRIGTRRFILLWIAGSIGAVGLHLALHWDDIRPVIGASGVVSAATGAAARFAFHGWPRSLPPERAPRLKLAEVARSRPTMIFVAVWFVANILFGAGLIDPGQGASIAWEAHIGGFLVGLLGFSAFDRVTYDLKDSSPEPSIDL